MKRQLLFLSIAGLSLLAFSGCFNHEEEMTLRRNGSGEVTMHYWIKSNLLSGMDATSREEGPKFEESEIRRQYEKRNGIKLKEARVEQQGGDTHAYVTLAFKSVEALNAVEPGREISFSRERGKITYASTMKGKSEAREATDEQAPQGLDDVGKSLAKGMGDAMSGMMSSVGGGDLTFTVHFPGEVLTVGGPGATKDGNTARWKMSFGDLTSAGVSGGLAMKATAKAGWPIPRKYVVWGVVVLVLIIVLKSRKKRRW